MSTYYAAASQEEREYIEIRVTGATKEPIMFDQEHKITLQTTVIELKKKIANRIGHDDINTLRFLHAAAKDLTTEHDSKTLKQMRIENSSTIVLAFRVRGGSSVNLKIILYDETELSVKVD